MKVFIVRKPYEEGAKELPGSDAFDICVPEFDLEEKFCGWCSLITRLHVGAWRDDLVIELPEEIGLYSPVTSVFEVASYLN